MRMSDFPPTQLYASLAFVLSVVTLWLSRLKDDEGERQFIQSLNRHAVNHTVSFLLVLPIAHVLYVLALSPASVGHKIAHAIPLVGGMLSIIAWWMRTIAVTSTVEDEAGSS